MVNEIFHLSREACGLYGVSRVEFSVLSGRRPAGAAGQEQKSHRTGAGLFEAVLGMN